MATKQVIVIRKDLKMRRGKEIAQASHASMAFLARRLIAHSNGTRSIALTITEQEWLDNSFTKVTVQVQSEEALLTVAQRARDAGLEVHLVTDAGRTEFNGVPTITCCAIGPDESEKIDPITGELELY